MCRPLGVKTVCSSRCTLRNSLVHVKQPTEDKKKKGVIYEVPCKACECVYIGETGRTLEKRLSEEERHQEWHCGSRLDQPTPGGLGASQNN